MKKKNCHNCTHLDYIEAEANDPSGYACDDRNYSGPSAELRHLDQLESKKYRETQKKCCEVK